MNIRNSVNFSGDLYYNDKFIYKLLDHSSNNNFSISPSGDFAIQCISDDVLVMYRDTSKKILKHTSLYYDYIATDNYIVEVEYLLYGMLCKYLNFTGSIVDYIYKPYKLVYDKPWGRCLTDENGNNCIVLNDSIDEHYAYIVQGDEFVETTKWVKYSHCIAGMSYALNNKRIV